MPSSLPHVGLPQEAGPRKTLTLRLVLHIREDNPCFTSRGHINVTLSCSGSLVKTHPYWFRRGTRTWGQTPFLDVSTLPHHGCGGHSHSRQPLNFTTEILQQGGEGGQEWHARGSDALLAKPLKKASSLGKVRCHLLPSLSPPRSHRVLLTSLKKRLVTDSSNGNERAKDQA